MLQGRARVCAQAQLATELTTLGRDGFKNVGLRQLGDGHVCAPKGWLCCAQWCATGRVLNLPVENAAFLTDVRRSHVCMAPLVGV